MVINPITAMMEHSATIFLLGPPLPTRARIATIEPSVVIAVTTTNGSNMISGGNFHLFVLDMPEAYYPPVCPKRLFFDPDPLPPFWVLGQSRHRPGRWAVVTQCTVDTWLPSPLTFRKAPPGIRPFCFSLRFSHKPPTNPPRLASAIH